jgi:hypothetical protein
MKLRGHGEDDMARNSQKKLTKKTANTKGTGSASSKASAKKGSKPAAKKALKAPAKKAKKLAKIKSTGGYWGCTGRPLRARHGSTKFPPSRSGNAGGFG